MKLWASLVFSLIISSAWSKSCQDRPYTLSTKTGLLGGMEMTYDGEELVFEGRACFERQSFYLEAPVIRYIEVEGRFHAEGLGGEVQGWQVEARALEGKELLGAHLRRGSLQVYVERLFLEDPPQGEGVLLQAPGYRVRAEEVLFTREEARLRGFLATPCPCGEDLRLAMEEASFDVATGELLGEARLGFWGLEFPLGEARANVNRAPKLRSPLVLGVSEAGGVRFGVEDLPLPRPGEEVGRWGRSLTLVAEGMNTSRPSLRLGLRQDDLALGGRLGYAPGVWASWGDVYLAYNPSPPDLGALRLEARYAPAFQWQGVRLSPFLRYAETGQRQGVTLGLEAAHRWGLGEGPFRLTLAPEGLLALYPFAAYSPYLALGGSVEARYQEGGLTLGARYAGRLEPLSPTPAFAYEDRDEYQSLRLEGRLGPWGLAYALDNPLGQRRDQVEVAYQDEALGTLRLAWVRGSHEEVRLAYAMPLPPRTCCQAFWLAPEVGFGDGRISRYGLTLRYYDGCFAYEARFQNVLKGQYGEATGLGFSLGLSLR